MLYYRNGTYHTSEASIENGVRLAMSSVTKPIIWLAYPGETPVVDTTGGYISISGAETNIYVQGISFENFTEKFGFAIDSPGTDNVFFNNRFSNLPKGDGGIGSNASAIFVADGGSTGNYWAFLNNAFQGIHDPGYGLLGSGTGNVLVQGNTFTDFTDPNDHVIGPKQANSMWFIRDNRTTLPPLRGGSGSIPVSIRRKH